MNARARPGVPSRGEASPMHRMQIEMDDRLARIEIDRVRDRGQRSLRGSAPARPARHTWPGSTKVSAAADRAGQHISLPEREARSQRASAVAPHPASPIGARRVGVGCAAGGGPGGAGRGGAPGRPAVGEQPPLTASQISPRERSFRRSIGRPARGPPSLRSSSLEGRRVAARGGLAGLRPALR